MCSAFAKPIDRCSCQAYEQMFIQVSIEPITHAAFMDSGGLSDRLIEQKFEIRKSWRGIFPALASHYGRGPHG